MVNKTKIETLEGLLKNLEDSTDIEASSVVSADGFMIVSALPQEQKERIAVMSASLHSLGETTARELGRGGLTEVYIKGENGSIVVIPSGNHAVLTTLTRNDGLDAVFPDVKRTAREVAELI